MRRQFIIAAIALWSLAGSAVAEPVTDSLTPKLTVGFEFGSGPTPGTASRLTASFNVNSRWLLTTPSLFSRMAATSEDVQQDIDLAGRGVPLFTLFDVSASLPSKP
jgi:hypothetical protein